MLKDEYDKITHKIIGCALVANEISVEIKVIVNLEDVH
jgi:hypothetical protein